MPDPNTLTPRNPFDRFSKWAARRTGHGAAFLTAFLVIVVWAATGPLFGFRNPWQLVIKTGTTIVTFLMVFLIQTKQTDGRLQSPHLHVSDVEDLTPLCPAYLVHVSGFSVADDDGDDNKTPGVPTFMLIDHTIDPTGVNGPATVGFRAFRSFPGGTPYVQGGNPTIDQQRYELMVSKENIDPENGFINAIPGDQKGDYSEWASIGPYVHLPDGGHISATVAFGVRLGRYRDELGHSNDYERAA